MRRIRLVVLVVPSESFSTGFLLGRPPRLSLTPNASWRSAGASVFAVLLAVCAMLGGCVTPGSVERDGLVTTYERLPILPFGNESQVLLFRGKKYTHLYSQGYVKVPELDGIIFATRRGEGNVKLRFVPMHGKGEITVDEGEVWSFGLLLGCPRANANTEYVESVADSKVTFFSSPTPWGKRRGRTEGLRFVLDLRQRKFWKVEDSGEGQTR